MYERDNIAAIATPPGSGGVAIIRVSGPDAETIAQSLFLFHQQPSRLHSHHLYFGTVIDPQSEQSLDQGLFTIMRAPHSYTGENVAEIHCHGGGFLARRVLTAILRQGARLAQPGEFTKRAFLNGRLDLTQAEAVLDLIQAKSDQGVLLAWEQLSGHLSEAYSSLRQRLMRAVAYIEAFLDFPEDEIPARAQSEIMQEMTTLLADISSLAATFAQGRVYRDGIRTAIVGKPNVGKSSLLNMLVGTERAIVTAIPGTTRDVLEETVVINGIPLVLWDTAGLRHTDDEVERIGVARAQAGAREAELVLAVFDVSRPFDQEDAAVVAAVTGKQVVAILNKIDLPIILSEAELEAHFPQTVLVKLSSKTGMGKSELEQRMQEIIFGATVWQEQQHNFVVTNVRHRDSLIKTGQSLENAIAGLRTVTAA